MDTIPQDTPQKQCTRCKEWMDATPAFFYRQTKAKDGFQSQCKSCIGTPREPVPDGHKRCKKCGNIWLATSEYFYADKREKDGFRCPCKQCLKSYEQTDARKVQKKPYKHQHYMQNQEETKQRSHEYYLDHKEAYIKVYPARYRAKHRKPRRAGMSPEVRRAHRRQLYHESYSRNPGYYIALVNKRKARKKSVPGTHTPQQIKEQLQRQKYRCYYAACGHAKFEKRKGKYVFHVDHTFPLSRVAGTDIPANSIDYLVLTCPTCNLKKHDKFPWEFPEGGRLL